MANEKTQPMITEAVEELITKGISSAISETKSRHKLVAVRAAALEDAGFSKAADALKKLIPLEEILAG